MPTISTTSRLVLGSLCLTLLFVAAWAGQSPATPEETVSLAFAGDIMLDTLPGEDIEKGLDPFADFAAYLDKADLSIGNLECVVATKGKPDDKPYTFRAHPRVLAILKKHFHAVTLANNHTGDFGHEAFLEQLELLKKNQIGYFGGGANVIEARTPWIVEKKGVRIAFLGYNDFQPRRFEAGPHWPGVAWGVPEQIIRDIKAARTIHRADLVIPVMHWGWEMFPANKDQKKLARLMIDHGADLVVGGHPHVTQGVEYYRDKLIVYSLGNFVFDGFNSQKTRTGWLLRVDATKKGVTRWDTLPLWLDERGTPRRLLNFATPFGSATSPKIEERFFPR